MYLKQYMNLKTLRYGKLKWFKKINKFTKK